MMQVDIWCNRLGLSVPVRKDRIGLSNLVDKAMNLYEKHLITYEKLDYLLEFAELTPKEMGIERESTYLPPTDEELDARVLSKSGAIKRIGASRTARYIKVSYPQCTFVHGGYRMSLFLRRL